MEINNGIETFVEINRRTLSLKENGAKGTKFCLKRKETGYIPKLSFSARLVRFYYSKH